MWSDILWWSGLAIALYLAVRMIINVDNAAKSLRDEQIEGIIAAHRLEPGPFYLFVWDIRTISMARANDLRCMLHARGIDSGCMRIRPGTPPLVYDLKQPVDPMKGTQ